ncbi:MAG: cell division protein FtsK [Bdellovibrionaceae bacterium]|nr:cell division protein FtsK [Pseudobdellovibrionaceae bacterium]
MNHVINKFRRDIVGTAWLALAVFVGLALVSFNPRDPSFNSIGKSLEATNYCGYFGSFLSDILYQVMGLTAWVLVLASIRLAWMSFRGREVGIRNLRYLWALLLVVTSSSLMGLYWPETYFFSGQVPVGGLLGITVSHALVSIFNFYGVAIILWALTIVLTIFYTEKTLKDLLLVPREVILDISDRMEEQEWGVKIMNIFRAIVTPFRKMRLPQLGWSTSAGTTSGTEENDAGKALGFFKISKKDAFDTEEEEEDWEEEEEYADEDEVESDEFDEEFPPIEAKVGTQLKLVNQFSGKKKKRRVKLKAKISRHIENWELPKLSLLEDPPLERRRLDEKEIRVKSRLLVDKLEQFNVGGKIVGIKPGPAVTMFEFKPNIDVKISKITDLADDLSLALSSESVRIIAPIPGRDVVGIETSNSFQETVYLKDIVAEDKFWEEDIKLPVPLGRQANGDPKIVDLRKMPHLMVAGTTGSGKSVFIVSFITSLLFKHSPKTLRMILVDPKQVDLAIFNDVPHLMMPPIREPKKAVVALRWAIREMEKRYASMAKFGARNIESFNEKVAKLKADDVAEHEQVNAEFEENMQKNQTYYWTPQPYVVLVVEEFGDLMAVDKQNVEQGVVRLAQMARASGIHLVLAMQSPRKDVVTGLIKTNIPGRASFKVASKLDSRVILDESGAERLLARGDMLFLAPGVSKPERHHGAYLTEEEINGVIEFWSEQGEPEYDELAMKALEGSGGGFDLNGDGSGGLSDSSEEYDERYDEILSWASTQKGISASLIQRKFRLGYPRAARLIEVFEAEGVVGPANGSKPRKVLINNYEAE